MHTFIWWGIPIEANKYRWLLVTIECSRFFLFFLGGINCRFLWDNIPRIGDKVPRDNYKCIGNCRQGLHSFRHAFRSLCAIILFPIPGEGNESARLAVQTGKFNAPMESSSSGCRRGPRAIVEWQLAITRPRNHNRTELFAIPQPQSRPTPRRTSSADNPLTQKCGPIPPRTVNILRRPHFVANEFTIPAVSTPFLQCTHRENKLTIH